MKTFFIALFTLSLSQFVLTAPAVPAERRAANTCGDPSVSSVFVQAFNPSKTAHITRARWAIVWADTQGGGDQWQIQGPIFRAWETNQTGTVPFYQLGNAAGTDFIFLPSLDGSLPSASGFQAPLPQNLVGWVYPTQICGSIPLLVASQPTASDHWYTTITTERDSLVANGWVDGGVVAFVLPLNSD